MFKNKKMKVYIHLFRLIREAESNIFFISLFFFYLIIAVSNIIAARGLGNLIAKTVELQYTDLSYLVPSLFMIIGGKLVFVLITFVAELLNSKLSVVVRMIYQKKSMEGFISADYTWVMEQNTGDILNRILGDVDDAAYTVSTFTPVFFKNVITSIGVISALFYTNWLLGLVLLIMMPFIFISQRLGNILVQKHMDRLREAHGDAATVILDVVNNRASVKVFRLEATVIEWIDKKLQLIIKLKTRAMTILVSVFSPAIIFGKLPLILVCGIGCSLVAKDVISAEVFIMSFMLSISACDEFSNINDFIVNIPSLLASGKRLFLIWDAPKHVYGQMSSISEEIDEVLVLKDISYTYSSKEDKCNEMAVKNFNLSVKNGEKVAIIGSSGCGKSTIFKLISGIYIPKTGKISIYGREPRDWSETAFPKIIGNMTQDTFLFPMSVKENILIANENISEDEFNRAIESSNLERIIQILPNGLDTNVGEQGQKLSVGQRQMTAIARLFVQDPRILLLDEATSSLDAQNETDVYNALQSVFEKRTILMITHKPSMVKNFDRIIVMDKGEICEIGSHEELINNGKQYKQLWENSLKE